MTAQVRQLRSLAPAPSPVEPILKWAGGKSRIMGELLERLPDSIRQRSPGARYFEPFLGGGALFFNLQPVQAELSDVNEELINVYRVVRDDVQALIRDLERHRYEKTYYYAMRAADVAAMSPLQRASRTIFLNRTCFNGLYRVNRRGQFNVPMGRYKAPRICQKERLLAAHEALQGRALTTRGFEAVGQLARPGDFVYFDPPYVPISATANFTSYAQGDFGPTEQEALASLFDQLAARGVHCMLSNSATPWVRERYSGHHVAIIDAPRSISRAGARRRPVEEVLVTSYRPSANVAALSGAALESGA